MKAHIVFRHFHVHHWIISIACLLIIIFLATAAILLFVGYEISGFDGPYATHHWVVSLARSFITSLGFTETTASRFVLVVLVVAIAAISQIFILWRDRIYRHVSFDVECDCMPRDGINFDSDSLF